MTSLTFFLRLNAANCLGFGALFLIQPGGVASVVGTVPPRVLVGLGAVLLFNGVHLLFASMRTRRIRAEILWFSAGDMAWWLATLALIVSGVWITAPAGITAALIVALCVAGFGMGQLFHLGLIRSGLPGREHWQRIGRSWLALPLWVKIWLFALNAAFLLSPIFLPWEAARIVLIAYVASGPLLGAFAVYEGGLTRIMGLAHLLPWAPMLVWLATWIVRSDAEDLARGYALLVATMTGLCLAFDVHDLWQWIRGDRDVVAATSDCNTTPRPASTSAC